MRNTPRCRPAHLSRSRAEAKVAATPRRRMQDMHRLNQTHAAVMAPRTHSATRAPQPQRQGPRLKFRRGFFFLRAGYLTAGVAGDGSGGPGGWEGRSALVATHASRMQASSRPIIAAAAFAASRPESVFRGRQSSFICPAAASRARARFVDPSRPNRARPALPRSGDGSRPHRDAGEKRGCPREVRPPFRN